MKVEKYIVVHGGRYSARCTYYNYNRSRLNTVSSRKKHPTIYVNNIDRIVNRLSDESLLRQLFYSRNGIDSIYRVEIYFVYDSSIYLVIYTNEGEDVFCINVDEIDREFSMIDVLGRDEPGFDAEQRFQQNMILRFGCDEYANHCRRESKSSIPGYYNHD